MNQNEFDTLPAKVRLKHYAEYMKENKLWMYDVVFLSTLKNDQKVKP